MKYLPVYFTLFMCLYLVPAKAQLFDFLSVGQDSSCISDESGKLLLRGFIMQKFNKFTLGQNGIVNNVTYRANDNYNIGFGGHYKWIGLNFSFRMPFVNNDDDRLGETKFFDLQSYLYLNNIAVDLFILSYKGYYMANSDILKMRPADNDLLLRSDLRTGNYGMNIQYIFNSDRFSYRAAFLQNQCQMQSAGSVIAGGGIHYTRAKADSAMIPDIENVGFFQGDRFNKSSVFTVAVNGGYAYTQVIRQHFFITGSVLVGVGINYASLKADYTNSRDAGLHGQMHAILRGAAGYNTSDYFIGVQYYNYISRNNTPIPQTWQQLQAGSIRLTYARRFKLKKTVVEKLNDIENSIVPEL